MKFLIVLAVFVALAAAQFGNFGGGGFGGGGFGKLPSPGGLGQLATSGIQQGLGNLGKVAQLVKPPSLSNVQSFADFAAQTGKQYASAAEQTLRQGLVEGTVNLVDAGNAAFQAGTRGFASAVNAFADLTKAEWLSQLTGNKKSAAGEQKAQRHRHPPQKLGIQVPDSFDWRDKGGVTDVKYQGQCGSCWSFATTGAIEGHVFRKTGRLPNLSEQNLVDCGNKDFGLVGCDGGFQEYAYEFIISQNGIADGEVYPYVDNRGKCQYTRDHADVEIKGFASIEPGDEDNMKEIVATLGPLACSINGLESLVKLYDHGIYDDEECNNEPPNHSILVVGYGSEDGKDYWIVKNSWSDEWGEKGYFRLPRGKNFCKIAAECSYPIL